MINELNRRFLNFSFNGESKSIDESMISYCRAHDSMQRINNKPIRVGYNISVLPEAYGFLVQFEPYHRIKKEKQVAFSTKWGFGKKTVLRLMECLTLTLLIAYL